MASQTPKSVEIAGAAFPLELVAGGLLRSATQDVERAMTTVRREHASPRAVHALRLAIRRAESVLPFMSPCLKRGGSDGLARQLRRLRKEAGSVRSLQLLREVGARALADRQLHRDAVRVLERAVAPIQAEHERRLTALVDARHCVKLKRESRHVAAALSTPADGNPLFYEAALRILEDQLARLNDAMQSDLCDPVCHHTARIEVKRLRYSIDAARVCVPPELADRAEAALRTVQTQMGRVTDLRTFIDQWRKLVPVTDRIRLHVSTYIGSLEREADHASAIARSAIQDPEFQTFLADLSAWLHESNDRCGRIVGDAEAIANAAGTMLARPERLAVIDVGSNSVRLLIAEVLPDGSYRTLDDERVTTRLGQGLVATGSLTPEAMERTAEAIARMRGIARGYAVSRLRVIGTSAARDALNRREFVSLVRERAGVILEILSSEDEARLAHKSVVDGFDLADAPAAVVDIGGGSTEIVLSTNGVIEQLCSTRLGAVRLTEMFSSYSGRDAVRAMRRYVNETMARALPSIPFAPALVVGTGGTFSTLIAIVNARSGTTGTAQFRTANDALRRAEVKHILDRLAGMTLKERERVAGIAPGRADIIVAGAAVAEGVLRYLCVNRLRIHDRGIRDGLMLSMIESARDAKGAGGQVRSPGPMHAVRIFAESCRYERDHSEHVAQLATSILDQLESLGLGAGRWITPETRFLLEAAAVLHDVGNLINYAEHHKHSYRFIMNGRIPRLNERQTAIIANVARYHRRAEPSKRHSAYAALSARDRSTVRRLAAILRVADGLDRTHTQAVRGLRLELGGTERGQAATDPVRQLTLHVAAEERPTTDLWGSERKSGLFAAEFGVDLFYAWADPASPRSPQSPPAPLEAVAPRVIIHPSGSRPSDHADRSSPLGPSLAIND